MLPNSAFFLISSASKVCTSQTHLTYSVIYVKGALLSHFKIVAH
jgi:hypothetical protein